MAIATALLTPRCTVGFIAVLCIATTARAEPVYLANIPDFYQHQLSGWDVTKPFNRPGQLEGYSDPASPSYSNVQPLDDGGPGVQWERNGGWCTITSFTDVFYQLDKKGVQGLFDHGGDYTWLERMNYAIADFAIKYFGLGGNQWQTIDQFIADKVGAGRVSIDLFSWDAARSRVLRNGEATAFSSMYGIYREQLGLGNAAVLDLINPGAPNPDWWWSSSYHMVAAAGYDDATSGVYYADPNNRGGDPALSGWGHPFPVGDPLPVGSTNYSMNVMDETGLLSGPGGLSGARLRNLYVLSIVPEIDPAGMGSVLAMVTGALGLLERRRLKIA